MARLESSHSESPCLKSQAYEWQPSNEFIELHSKLFSIWIKKELVLNKRREYKVPARILALPCGCCRDRLDEGDFTNTWKIKKITNKEETLEHKECGSIFKLDGN